MKLGWGKDNPGPKSLAASLSNASDMISALSAGDGMNRWSFVNRGDMDGQWQLVRTWDISKKEYLHKVISENTSYYGFAMFSRFIAKHASILKITSPENAGVSALSVKNPDGNLVVILLNQSTEKKEFRMNIRSKTKIKNLYEYRYDDKIPEEGDFELNPIDTLSGSSSFNLILEKQSITVLSTKLLKNSDKGISSQERVVII